MSDNFVTENCRICPRNCGKLRDSEKGFGYCKMPALPVLARAGLHFYEEPCISGSHGSGAVFFSGCTLGCVYCQNYEISARGFGKTVSVERLAEIFRELEAVGAHNINLVNPTHFTASILKALDIYRPNIPIIYNCSGYETVETLKTMEGYMDIYLPDLKYVNAEKSARYSAAGNYFAFAGPALMEMQRQVGNEVMDGKIMRRGMIIRHLILPQGTAEAILVAKFVCENFPIARFSLMSQYLPMGEAEHFHEINRKTTAREYDKVASATSSLPFQNAVYVQELSSSDQKFIPVFDLSGV